MPSKELGEPSVKMVVSSAYCESVYSTTSIESPLMSLLFLIKNNWENVIVVIRKRNQSTTCVFD